MIALELNAPSDIYQRVNEELGIIIDSLNAETDDGSVKQAQDDARSQLSQCQKKLTNQLSELEKNAEWNTFTIAFYGETGAGKSTIIETLRILLKEPTKLASQAAFQELQDRYGLNEGNLQILQSSINKSEVALDDIAKQLNAAVQQNEQMQKATKDNIARIQEAIVEIKKTASFWQKFLNIFRKIPEEIELAAAEQQLLEIIATGEKTVTSLRTQQTEEEKNKISLECRWKEFESHKAELSSFADGEIIGDGRTDFTRKTQRYNFELDGQTFALLDVPGIEGNEGLIRSQIEQAVQTAHAVFYVTNQPAPPQTGEEQRKGTLEKIKEHLGSQAEVWTIFNKKITSPKNSLAGRQLTSDDENKSLEVLNDKMREQLGRHYRETFTLTALPAFLVSTDHFVPDSQNARRRKNIFEDFSRGEILEKSRVNEFLRLLRDVLIIDSKAKIKRANFNKAKETLIGNTEIIEKIKKNFVELSERLEQDGDSAKSQLNSSYKALKRRLISKGDTIIDKFDSAVRDQMYELIEDDINNDNFKYYLRDQIESKKEKLSKDIPEAISNEIARFQRDVEEIITRFASKADELSTIYKNLSIARIDRNFDFKIKIDNGINVYGLLGGFIGLALAPFTGGASLWVAGVSALTSLVSVGKALLGALSSKYKKSQQRKSTDEILRNITEQLRESLRDSLELSLTEMHKIIIQITQAIDEPAKQTAMRARLLESSLGKLKILSHQIEMEGNLV